MSELTIRWLPLGHVAHGYRRVFVIEQEKKPYAVIAFSLMPYESVYQVKNLAAAHNIQDPSLWWGLSLAHKILADPSAFEAADDHFMSVRPGPIQSELMIPIEKYEAAKDQGMYTIVIDDGVN